MIAKRILVLLVLLMGFASMGEAILRFKKNRDSPIALPPGFTPFAVPVYQAVEQKVIDSGSGCSQCPSGTLCCSFIGTSLYGRDVCLKIQDKTTLDNRACASYKAATTAGGGVSGRYFAPSAYLTSH
eukprot:TRINITY_DN2785_c0_g1_i2.p1 TRINITY_DN2785_c0_g1~~TRINITY_DN2785_c0_g1_i2.p1  ORF type:complete len:127 (+),score=26.21 TRINITY_DN2785_c0_g1_i2:64-444(+)